MSGEHPSDWRWDARMLRWEHPHARSTISVIEPAEESERSEPTAAFGFGRDDDDGVWEGMGL